MIFHAAPWVVPISRPPIADGVVAVDERGTIRGVGKRNDLRATGDLRSHPGILMPGLVNAHTHLELSHLGLIPGGDGLASWIRRLLQTRGAPDPIAIEAAAQRMAARGTVAVADVANGPIAAPILRASGLEVVDLDERLDSQLAPARAGATRTAHSTYTCRESTLRQFAALASIHVEEDPAEAHLLVEGSGPLAELLRERGKPFDRVGKRPISWLDSLGAIGDGTLLVHLTFADDASLKIARERNAVAVLCPRSNRHISGRLPPFSRIRELALRVALGTDSLASSPSLDLFGDIQCLARVGAEAAWLLQAATTGGALALKMPHLGALEPGRRPGLLHVGANYGDRPVRDPLLFLAHEAADAPVERLA
jgi:cytosine/adenosine deaminase-related metal-dependent hydrolase